MDALPSPLSTVAQYWRDGVSVRTGAQPSERPGDGRRCDFGEGRCHRRAPSHREAAAPAPVLLARSLLDAFGLDALDLLHILSERRAERPGQVPQRLDLPIVFLAADPLVPGVEMPVRLLQQRPGPGQPVAVSHGRGGSFGARRSFTSSLAGRSGGTTSTGGTRLPVAGSTGRAGRSTALSRGRAIREPARRDPSPSSPRAS